MNLTAPRGVRLSRRLPGRWCMDQSIPTPPVWRLTLAPVHVENPINSLVIRFIVATSLSVAGCASVPEPSFTAHYAGSVHDAHMDLDLLRDLPEHGTSGSLVHVEESQADARFSAGAGGPPKYTLEPTFVKFSADTSDQNSPARFHWEGDALIVCMRYAHFMSDAAGKLVIVSDYDYCAPMRSATRK